METQPAVKIIFSDQCLGYESPGHPESPERVRLCAKLLRRKRFKFIQPFPCREEDILLAHSKTLLDRVKNGRFFDPDTPNLPGIFEYACLSAGAAVKAQEVALFEKVKALSLMRPPGHHAGYFDLGGFCYFNNIAIAIKKALVMVKKAAIIDLDCHHGNGTQEIFAGESRVLFVSLHQSPLYPGTGLHSTGNLLNYPLDPGTDEKTYLAILKESLEKIRDFQPDVLGISLGFDTYRKDPITNLSLEISSYRKIGLMIAELPIQSFAVLEGGYHPAIAECLYQFILGWGKQE